MNIAGIELQAPAFWPLTRAVFVGVVLWALFCLAIPGSVDLRQAGGYLVAILFGTVSHEAGLQVRRGGRHLALSIAGCAVAVALYRLITLGVSAVA